MKLYILLVGAALFLAGCEEELTEDNRTCRTRTGHKICGPSSVRLTINGSDTIPVVDATVNGESARLLIDTSRKETVLSSTRIGAPDGRTAFVEEICFRRVCFENEEVRAEDTDFSSPDDGAINGMVGLDMLGPFVTIIDAAANSLTLTLNEEHSGCAGTDVQVSVFDGPLVSGKIFGEEQIRNITVDTSRLASAIGSATVTAHAPDGFEDSGQSSEACDETGCRDVRETTLDEFCVGDYCQSDVLVQYPEAKSAAGFTFLTTSVVELDLQLFVLRFCDPE